MKKFLIILNLVAFLTINSAFAAGMVYDPTEFSSNKGFKASDVNQIPSTKEINSNIKSMTTLAQDSVSAQSDNFNNALFELDNAQVSIRNELLDYKAKYQEVDTQYKLIKEQRKVLSKQIKDVEKRIKSIENSKNHIRKTMI